MSYKSNETNKGKPWSKEEKDDLLKELLERKSFDEIAESHKRSSVSIKYQGLNIAVEMLDTKSIDEVVEMFIFSKDKIEEWQVKLDYKKIQSDTRKEEREKLKEENKKFDNKMLYDKITGLSKEILTLKTTLINIKDKMIFHEEEIARLKGKPTMSPEPEL